MNRTAYVIVAKEQYVTILSFVPRVSRKYIFSQHLSDAETYPAKENAEEHAAALRKRYPRTKFEVRRVVLQ